MKSSSLARKFVVFVSHAGEDKSTVALPLRKMLSGQDITAFVDEADIPTGSGAIAEMTAAMRTADIAVIVLSPEFVAKKWPMKELLFFLRRREKAQAKGESVPVIIPVFYRLSVADIYNEPNFEHMTSDGRNLYDVTRFDERRKNGEPEADIKVIRHALRSVHGIMGVENKDHASNEESSLPSRQLLLEDICEKISQALVEYEIPAAHIAEAADTCENRGQFRKHFHAELLRTVVLDFASVDANGEPLTQEGRIKRRILNRDGDADQVIAMLGIGGVGKSTILKALVNDKDLRERFCDGIHFISLGKDATNRTLSQELSRVLHDSGATRAASKLETKRVSEETVREAIREAIREALSWFRLRSCLFLIDDVWTIKLGKELFSHVVKLAGDNSTALFTTREHEIASVAVNDESIFRVAPREAKGLESRDILFCHAGTKDTDTRDGCSPSSIDEILNICGGLPVSLAAAGKGVKMMGMDMTIHEGDTWTEYLKILLTCREQLLRESVGEYGNLYITFRASMSLLEGHEDEKLGFRTRAHFAEMHRRLCVLPKQDLAPMSMLRHLWELNNESEASAIARQFVEVGLADSKFRKMNGNVVWDLAIHDSIHDFAVAEAKRRGDIVRTHYLLLNGYCGQRYTRSHRLLWYFARVLQYGSITPWWHWVQKYGKDEYIKRNVCHHLAGAEEFEDKESMELSYFSLSGWESFDRREAAISFWEDLISRTHLSVALVLACLFYVSVQLLKALVLLLLIVAWPFMHLYRASSLVVITRSLSLVVLTIVIITITKVNT